ncbi:MAG TPA: ABC transporter permease [Pyrinomonadaceae bacterium]|nr:ABC transporter permease [Pyrinomonadaceae bacterium]
MRKFFAILKREYIQRLRSRMFILITVLGPVMISLFGIAPALALRIKAGGPLKIAVVDQTGKLYQGVYRSLTDNAGPPESGQDELNAAAPGKNPSERFQQLNDKQEGRYEIQEVRLEGRPLNVVEKELDRRVLAKELDGYLILPADLLQEGKPQYFGRNTGDVFTRKFLQEALSKAVRQQRLAEANIDPRIVQELSEPVKLEALKVSATGDGVRDSGEGFALVFGAGFIMYLTILMYGQMILGAVIEEKETRIGEILFSSVKPFTLMMGKLVGVSLLALTQLAIWGLAFVALVVYGVGMLAANGMTLNVPHVPLIHFVYFGLFFLMGYFIYSTIYALIGSMVTTAQEGGQLSMPVVLFPLIGFYLFLPVSRSPDSSFAFWASMFPFFSPMTMLVRIVTQTPPWWQIALSLLLGFSTVALVTWLAGRVYRVGMLMAGKKASIPEVVRWLRQP